MKNEAMQTQKPTTEVEVSDVLVFNVTSCTFTVLYPLILYEVELEDAGVLLASVNTGNPVSKDHSREENRVWLLYS